MPEMPALVGGLFINPVVLWLILLCIDRHNSDRSWFKLFLLSLGICVVTGILSLCYPLPLASIIGVIFALFVSVFALHRFCDLEWLGAIISAILFTVWLIVWPILGMFLLTKLVDY
jgi:hypothetical protein